MYASHRTLALIAGALLTALPLTSCGGDSEAAPKKLRFTGIPDSDKANLEKNYDAIKDYLTAELGVEVEWIPVTDYTAAVVALQSNKVDFAWLGGVTAVEAEERCDGDVTFVACRDTDLKFKSYFIANKDFLANHGSLSALGSTAPQTVAALSGIAGVASDATFTFGSKSSTSGHIMPRFFMNEAGIDPEEAFESVSYRVQGGHAATLEAVASGAVEMGALNYTNWDKADDETKANAPVVYVTPEYVDYCAVAHDRLGKDMIARLTAAFVALDGSNASHRPVLDAFSANKFVAADPSDWDGIRSALAAVRAKGILQ